MNKLVTVVAHLLILLLLALAFALLGIAWSLAWLAREALGDRTSVRGMRFYRLLQRCGDTAEKLDAAIRISGEGVRW